MEPLDLPVKPTDRLGKDVGRPDFAWDIPMSGMWYVYIARQGTRILYVGMSGGPAARMGAHSRDSDWWGVCSHIEFFEFETKQRAQTQERFLISTLRPPYNTMGLDWTPVAIRA